jgi:hypothetical protein
MEMITSYERQLLESRIAEINQQLRVSSEDKLPGGGVPYELNKDEIDALFEERGRLMKKLDADLAA